MTILIQLPLYCKDAFLWSPVGRLAGGLNSFWILSFGRRRIIFLCVQHSQKYSGRWLLALCRRETLEGKVIVQYYDPPDSDVCSCAGKWSRCRRRRIFGRCRSRLLMRRVERRIPGRTEQSVGDRRFDAAAGADCSGSLSRYILSESSSSQSGLIRGNLRRIFCNKSKPGLFRPARIWEIPAGLISSSSASWLGFNPSFFIRSSNFSLISANFYKYKVFSFVKQVKSTFVKC